jgi:hypothetical protein
MTLPAVFCCCENVFTKLLPSDDVAIHFAEPLPSKNRHTDLWEDFMKDATEMGSCAVIYIPSFIKIDSGIQK